MEISEQKNTENKEKLKELAEEIYFPHDAIRDEQAKLIKSVKECLENKKNLVVHAPTGLGKTAATLCPALKKAIKEDLNIFFLTSRHTQHQIVIDTINAIKKKWNLPVGAVSIIGKKFLCAQPGAQSLYSSEFAEYCKSLKEGKRCEYYTNTRDDETKLLIKGKNAINQLAVALPHTTQAVNEHCIKEKVCPYEVSIELTKLSRVTIMDYYYLFNQSILNGFLAKTKKELEKTIIIIDEGHNLPNRLRELMTHRLTNFMIKKAVGEAKKFNFPELITTAAELQECLNKLTEKMREKEQLIKKEDFMDLIEDNIESYEKVIEKFEDAGASVRKEQKSSSLGGIATFLRGWKQGDKGFSRILSVEYQGSDQKIVLSNRCLDPAIIAKDVIEKAHSTILMSGTLTPTSMFSEMLGFKDHEEKTLESPFPEKNKLTLIIPKTSTQYKKRTPEQFKEIARICAEVTNLIPGNNAIFFPSYAIRDQVYQTFMGLSKKSCFLEDSKMTKQDKEEMLERFKGYAEGMGAVLLGAAAGSFGEGVDLPGTLLQGVIVVGLPLDRPDLETKEMIKYYDEKCGKGWDYGYIMPAITKTLQNAGRCIRTESDRGAIIFLEERYTWPNYFKCFPTDWDIKIAVDYEEKIREFFQIQTPKEDKEENQNTKKPEEQNQKTQAQKEKQDGFVSEQFFTQATSIKK